MSSIVSSDDNINPDNNREQRASTCPAQQVEQLRPYDEDNIREAIEEASFAYYIDGCMPFGAVLADANGTIVLRGRNGCPAIGKRGGSNTVSDCTRHAEMELIRKIPTFLHEQRGKEPPMKLSDVTLYASTEPCVMCAGAIFWSGVGRVLYGCSAKQLEHQLSGPGGFDIDVRSLYKQASPGARSIEIVGPVLSDLALKCHNDTGIWPMKLETGTTTGTTGTHPAVSTS